MKYPVLPVLALATLSAAASAQLAPSSTAPAGSRNDHVSFGLTYNHINGYFGNADGAESLTYDVRGHIGSVFFLTGSYTDNESLGVFSPYSWSLGAGLKFAVGGGNLEVSYAFRRLDLNPTIVPVSVEFDQNILKLGYTLQFGGGFEAGISVSEILNESTVPNLTAPEVSFGYRFRFGLSIVTAYSTENTVWGFKRSGDTFSLGVRYAF